MENLNGTKLLRGQKFENANDLLGAKEFVLLFYGGGWDQKSCTIIQQINQLLVTINQAEDDFARSFIECLYVSNDRNL